MKNGARGERKHAIKIPSSLGLFIVDSSCFFVSGPEVQKKRGEGEQKTEFKKVALAEKQKNKRRLKEKKSKR